MITVKGITYKTITDAAQSLGGVSTKTVRTWISKGIISEPPAVEYGIRTIQYFTEDYLKRAKSQLKYLRQNKISRKPEAK